MNSEKFFDKDSEWNTGISLTVQSVLEEDSIFPVQKYDWSMIT